MLLSNIFGKWLNKANKDPEEVKVANLPKHQQIERMVRKLETNTKQSFNLLMATTVSFQCVDTNLLKFSERIATYAGKIDKGEGLRPADCFTEMHQITLDKFFTDDDAMYIPHNTMRVFILSCDYLFTVIDRLEHAKDSDLSVHLRLMSKCFVSIQNFCSAMEMARNS